MKFSKIALSLAALLASGTAWSHGFVIDPPSRALLCNHISNPDFNVSGYAGPKNKNCGKIQYEPQSLEADKGYPEAGIKDGQIGSAEGTRGFELDATGMDRWQKTNISAGQHQFKWNFTAPHPTTKYEYFITNNNWNPNQPLTRAAFGKTPFCIVKKNGERPGAGASEVHTCNVPERQGYQAILAVWTVNDTSKAFYNILDVDFAGHNIGGDDATPPDDNDNNTPDNDGNDQDVSQAPVINVATTHLKVSESAINAGYKLDASKTQHATHYKWEVIEGFGVFQLQEKSGATTHRVLQGDTLNTPRAWVKGNNSGKGVYRLTVTNAQGIKAIKDITVTVIAAGQNDENNDTDSDQVANWVYGTDYKKGDVVKHNGKLFSCKESGWCRQTNEHSKQAYEPGTGTHWNMAWDSY